MRKTVVKYCLTALVFFTVSAHAQQQPMYTQYMFNGLVLNPAYAGSQETFTAMAMLRKQWAGVEGAPETRILSAHSPLNELRQSRRPGSPVSLGLILFNDRIAITTQTGLLVSYAYRLMLKNGNNISFGLQGGFSQLRVRYSELQLDDPSFAGGDLAEWQPDFGAGIYYQAQRFYAGLSTPQMLRSKTYTNRSHLSVSPHYFFTTGFVVDIAQNIKLKPNVLLKNFDGDVFQLDLNCNVLMNEIFMLGVSWRSLESIGTMVRFQLSTRFSLGYAYDIPCGSEFSTISSGSHEVMINYRVPRKKIRTINPRFF